MVLVWQVFTMDGLLEDALRSIEDGPTAHHSRPDSAGGASTGRSGINHFSSADAAASGSQPPPPATSGALMSPSHQSTNSTARSPKAAANTNRRQLSTVSAAAAAALEAKDSKSFKLSSLGVPLNPALSMQQNIAVAIRKLLAKGKVVSDELYVALVADAIQRLKAAVEARRAAQQLQQQVVQQQQQMQQQPQQQLGSPVSAFGSAALQPLPGAAELKYASAFNANNNNTNQQTQPNSAGAGAGVSSGADSARTASAAASAAAAASDGQYSGGWVLVGFPETLAQAQLLEKELSGYEPPKPKKAGAPKVTSKREERRASRLAPPPSPPSTTTTTTGTTSAGASGGAAAAGKSEPASAGAGAGAAPAAPAVKSGVDLVLRLDVDHESCARRALGRRIDSETGVSYHLESNAPEPEPTGIKPRLIEPTAAAAGAGAEDGSGGGGMWRARKLPDRFAAYDAHSAELQSWFEVFGTLQPIDAGAPLEAVGEQLSAALRGVMHKQQQSELERLLQQRREQEVVDAERSKQWERSQKLAEDAAKLKDKEKEQVSGAAAGGAASGSSAATAASGAAPAKGDAKAQPSAQQQQQQQQQQRKDAKDAAAAKDAAGKDPKRGSGAAKDLNSKKDGAAAASPAPSAAAAAVPPVAMPASAASAVDEPPIEVHELSHFDGFLDSEWAAVLAQRWIALETNYSQALKAFFRQMRTQRRYVFTSLCLFVLG